MTFISIMDGPRWGGGSYMKHPVKERGLGNIKWKSKYFLSDPVKLFLALLIDGDILSRLKEVKGISINYNFDVKIMEKKINGEVKGKGEVMVWN